LLTLTRIFALEYYAYRCDAPSLTSVFRYLGRLGLSRKKVQYIHRDLNPTEQVEYLLRIRHINPCLFVNIDGMIQKPGDYLAQFGWSPTGKAAILMQIVIGKISLPVYGAYTTRGWIAWEIYGEDCTGAHVANFVKILKPQLSNDSFAIVDNASNQRSEVARIALEDTFNGRFGFLNKYAPRNAPVESGFSNVKRMIQDHELEGQLDPIGLINRCFHYYSVWGPGSSKGDYFLICQ
jgi:hypothetical protein